MNTHEWLYDGSERRCRALLNVSDLPRIGRAMVEAHRRTMFFLAARRAVQGKPLTDTDRRVLGGK